MTIKILYTSPQLRIHIVENAGMLCQSNVQSRNVVEGTWDENE